jgi:hypothetical protein
MIMKLIKYLTVCLWIGIAPVACDYLDVVPDQVPTVDDVFSDRYTSEKMLATCYWGLPRTSDWNSNPALLGSMEMILNREYQTEKGMLQALGMDNAVSTLYSYWGSGDESGVRSLHGGIRDCNTFLDNIESVEDLTRIEKDRLIAEVKTIKAYMHFFLICYYGPICPLRESLPVDESTQGIRTYREKIDDCFAYVVQLLDEAIDSGTLPRVIENSATELGRFVRAAAYTLKAKVLVYWASDLFNGNRELNSFLDHNDEPFFNQEYNAQRWNDAAAACVAAVDICTQDGIRLYQQSDYQHALAMSDTIERVNALRSSFSERWNVELIWANTSTTVGATLQWAAMPKLTATTVNPTGILSVPFSTVELFYSSNGVPIEEDKSWAADGKYTSRFGSRTGDAAHKYYIKEGETTGAMNFDREPRFYSTLGFDRGLWYGNHYESNDESNLKYPRNLWGEFSSLNGTVDYNATGYWPKKYVSFNSTIQSATQSFCTQYAFPVIRFADLLLLTAEALNETAADENAAPDPEVYRYVDMIRERAGLGKVVDSWRDFSSRPNKPLTKSGMREIIRRERKIELACEGHHFWDSHRWRVAIAEQNNRLIQGWSVASESPGIYYTPNTVYVQKFTLRDYFAPIPESDLIKNPNLIQNPGW